MIGLRIYLLAGLIAHKAVWEVLKRKQKPASETGRKKGSVRLAAIKAAKITILLGIVAQTMAPDVLPLTTEPFIIQVVGTVVYSLGVLLAVAGRVQLGDNWSDIETAQVLENQALVSSGLYRYLQHPIYVGDLLLLIGLELALNSWLVVGVGLMVPVVLWKALREQRVLLQTLPGYDAYAARTKRFIPFVV